MIGVSLSPALLSGNPVSEADIKLTSAANGVTELLGTLKAMGVGSIEVRSIKAGSDPEILYDAVVPIVNAGLGYTVHGTLKSADTAVSDVLEPLKKIFEAGLVTSQLNITVHPIPKGCVEAARAICAEAEARGWNIALAIENNRQMPDKTEGDACPVIGDMVAEIDLPNVGTCWDFGHYRYSAEVNHDGDLSVLPPKSFLKKVRHTHIHALEGLRTHFPLDRCELPLKYYCDALGRNVTYNLELDPGRYVAKYDPYEALIGSVKKLRSTIPTLAAAQADLSANLPKIWDSAFSIADGQFSMIGPTGYIFRSAGRLMLIDPNIRSASDLCMMTDRIERDAAKIDFIVITHSHGDHYDKELLAKLVKGSTKLVMPDFMVNEKLYEIFPCENVIAVKDGETLELGEFKVRAFDSLHLREDGRGVKEYGYHITTAEGNTILIPGDIRNYDAGRIPSEVFGADHIFAHIWLGDLVSLKDETISSDAPLVCGCADFYTALTAGNPDSKIYLSHLFESGREMASMWSYRHAGAVMDAIFVRDSRLECVIPKAGKKYNLN